MKNSKLNSPLRLPSWQNVNSISTDNRLDKLNSLDRLTKQQHKTIARIYSEQALAYFREGNWQQAIIACQNALKLDPNNADAYKAWGNVLQRQGKKGEALGCYAKALENNPNLAEVYANIGSFYAEQCNWQQAISYYEKAITLKPDLPGVYRNLAQIWEEIGETARALEYLCQAVNLEPKTLTAAEYFSFGRELYRQGHKQKASIFYTHGVNLNPYEREGLKKLINILEELGNWQQAATYNDRLSGLQKTAETDNNLQFIDKPIKNLLSRKTKALLSGTNNKNPQALPPKERAITSKVLLPAAEPATEQLSTNKELDPELTNRQPESAISWNNLGSLYAKKQHWQKAISCYQEALQLDAKSSQTYRNLAKIYTTMGQTEKALDCWYEAFSLEPKSFRLENHLNLAKSLLKRKKVPQAIACLRQTIQLKPDCIEAYLILGEIFKTLGKKEEYKTCYLQVIKHDPKNALAYLRLAQLETEQENWQQATELYQRTITLKPNYHEAHHQLGEVLQQQEKWSEAIAAYTKAIASNPEFSWSYHNLGRALMKLGQWQEAADALARALQLNPEFDWGHYNLGEALTHLGDWDGAVKAYRRALEINPDLPQTAEKLADALRQRYELNHNESDRQEVTNFYQHALAKQPDKEALYYKMLEIAPDNAEIYLQLAHLYEEKGDPEQALAFRRIALQINPDRSQAAAAIARLKS